MNLTQFSLKNDRTVLALIGILFLFGLQSFVSIPKQQDPGFTIRTAVVSTRFDGASPARVEQLVTKRIEEKVQEMPELDFITSESLPGQSIVMVNFQESYVEMQPIFDDLRRKIEDIESKLPVGVQKPRVNDQFGDIFGSVYSLTGEGYSYAELADIAEEIRDELLKDSDVAKVRIHGEQKQVVFIDYKSATLTELGISPQQLAGILSKINIVSAGGNILSGTERLTLEPSGNFETIEDIKRTVVPIPNVGLVYLADIANVYQAYDDPTTKLTRVNGKPGLAIAVSMREGGDILKLGKRLDDMVPVLEAGYPWGIKLDKIWFQADLVKEGVGNFVSSLSQSVLIVVAVMLFFLGMRTGFVVASLIPLAIMISFYFMQVFSITINQVSLAALIIALGLLVDNAIVIVESILVKREEGASAVDAAVQAGGELLTPLLVSSLTTAAAFMPIALAESAVGEYTSDIFYVVTIALLTSWVLAMAFLPILSMYAMKNVEPGEKDRTNSSAYALYKRYLLWTLKHRLVTLIGVVLTFWLALTMMGLVPQKFIEGSEDPVFTAKLELPLGSSIETSEALVKDLDAFLVAEFMSDPDSDESSETQGPQIKSWATFIGEGGPRLSLGLNPPNENPANSFMVVNTRNGADVEPIVAAIEGFLTEQHPDLSKQVSALENGPPVGYPIIMRVQGESIDDLYRVAEEATLLLYDNPKVLSVKNSWGLPAKKLLVSISQERAQRAGVTSDDVAYALRANLQGQQLSEYRNEDKLLPILLRADIRDREDISKLDGLSVFSTSSNRVVPLSQVADVELAFQPGVIERRDRIRTLSLKTQLKPGFSAAEVTDELLPEMTNASLSWPSGVTFDVGGESRESDDAASSIGDKLPIAFMIILLLLVSQFNSLRSPVIIMVTIPLGLIGVVIGLLVARSSFGFFTILGIIALSGIIINNAIVLIDRINIERNQLGKPAANAIIDACCQRLRPIFLASCTTVLGMMPLLWGGTAMFRPMAVSIIFGLAFATLLTLFVVPILYSVLYRVNYKEI
ncbi:MAG: efflux RND transporter permease subunit [Arenicella sp.]|nr:efflux RND transporter permease subunit [Arenicella sp.]